MKSVELLPILILLADLSAPKVKAQAPSPAPVLATEISSVPDDVRHIEEPSLDPIVLRGATEDNQGKLLGLPQPRTQAAHVDRAHRWEGVEMIEDAWEPHAPGIRKYEFILAPGETASFTLKGVPHGAMDFLFALPSPGISDPLIDQLRLRNLRPRFYRGKMAEFSNTLDRTYRVVLILKGRLGLPFQIDIERKGGKPVSKG